MESGSMTAARQINSVQMGEAEARTLTDQIIDLATDLWELIALAYTERAWAALGYESWEDYVAQEFSHERLSVARGERPEVVAILRGAGLSVRAISAVTGDSVGTIHAEVVELDSAREVKGTDGKTHPAKRKPRPAAEKKKPQPKAPPVSNDLDMLAVARPDMAPDGTFGPSVGVGYGDPEFGACVVDGEVRWFSEGSYDEISPDAARYLAACLLAAADSI